MLCSTQTRHKTGPEQFDTMGSASQTITGKRSWLFFAWAVGQNGERCGVSVAIAGDQARVCPAVEVEPDVCALAAWASEAVHDPLSVMSMNLGSTSPGCAPALMCR
jgi:hypothetical protein